MLLLEYVGKEDIENHGTYKYLLFVLLDYLGLLDRKLSGASLC